MVSGVLPIISLAASPMAKILLSCKDTATTEGSCKTTPFLGTKTKELHVPKSMPIFLTNISLNFYSFNVSSQFLQSLFNSFVAPIYLIYIINNCLAFGNKAGDD